MRKDSRAKMLETSQLHLACGSELSPAPDNDLGTFPTMPGEVLSSTGHEATLIYRDFSGSTIMSGPTLPSAGCICNWSTATSGTKAYSSSPVTSCASSLP